MDNAIRIVYIVTVPETAYAFLRAQFRALKTNGYDVSLISSPGPKLDALQRELGIHTYSIKMERRAALVLDLISFFRILRILQRPDYWGPSLLGPSVSPSEFTSFAD
jgi:hypothetical protein